MQNYSNNTKFLSPSILSSFLPFYFGTEDLGHLLWVQAAYSALLLIPQMHVLNKCVTIYHCCTKSRALLERNNLSKYNSPRVVFFILGWYRCAKCKTRWMPKEDQNCDWFQMCALTRLNKTNGQGNFSRSKLDLCMYTRALADMDL